MYVHESLTQVVLFVYTILQLMTGLTWAVYDNACGAMCFVVKQMKMRHPACQAAWGAVARLKWACDRLHWHFHRACRDETSSYYNPDVNPYLHDELAGLNSEAAEQMFSICERWYRSCVFCFVGALRADSPAPLPCLELTPAMCHSRSHVLTSSKCGKEAWSHQRCACRHCQRQVLDRKRRSTCTQTTTSCGVHELWGHT